MSTDDAPPVSGDLNLLVALQALLEHRNVTHAGAHVRMSQPAMSGALARLRRHYDDELLVRVGRGYELTPLAQSLLPLVQETMRLAARTFDIDVGFDPSGSGRTFSIAMSDYVLAVLGEGIMQRIQAAAPGVRIDFFPLPTNPELDPWDMQLMRRDLIIVPVGYGTPGEREILYSDQYACIADPSNPRVHEGTLSIEALGELPHAGYNLGPNVLIASERRLHEVGVHARTAVTVPGFTALPHVVAGTDMVAFVPRRLMEVEASDWPAVIVDVPFEQVEIAEAMHWHESRSPDPGHEWLRAIVGAAAAALVVGSSDEDTPDPS